MIHSIVLKLPQVELKKAFTMLSLVAALLLFFSLNAYGQEEMAENNEFVNPDKFPELLTPTPIVNMGEYPEEAYQLGVDGRVQVLVLVDENGKYLEHQVRKVPHEAFLEVLPATLALLEFTPAEYRGEAIRCWFPVTIDYDYRAERKRRKKEES